MSRSRRRATPPGIARRVGAAAAVLVSLYYAVLGGNINAMELRGLSLRLQDAQVALEALRQEVDSLRVVEEELEDDPAAIERVARERFGMVYPGEILYRFVAEDEGAGR